MCLLLLAQDADLGGFFPVCLFVELKGPFGCFISALSDSFLSFLCVSESDSNLGVFTPIHSQDVT